MWYELFVCRKKGAVVIVSSGSCSQITPQMTVYAATKVEMALDRLYNNSELTFE